MLRAIPEARYQMCLWGSVSFATTRVELGGHSGTGRALVDGDAYDGR